MHFDRRRHLSIFYATQTGCSEEIAERIRRDAFRHHFGVIVRSMDKATVEELLSENLVIFVCSTTGQGSVPDMMKKFWRSLLVRSLPNDYLSHLKFAVFGLGDSSYQLFNAAAKKLLRRLEQLGALSVCRRGDGDDQHPMGV